MSNEELAEAYDEVCNACDVATRNSSDGGRMPCSNHKRLYLQRTYPVIHMDNFQDGEWTHCWVDGSRMIDLIAALLEDFKERGGAPEDYIGDVGLSVIQMTKEDYEKVPEL